MNAPKVGPAVRALSSARTHSRIGWDELFEDRYLALDSAYVFLVTAQALAARSELVVEVGCGRGSLADRGRASGSWQDLRGPGRCVVGIDIDPVGADNPVIDEFRLIGSDMCWPLDDASVDLAVCDWVLEHVTEPATFVSELARVLRPGGVFVARTINRASPLSLFAATWCRTARTPGMFACCNRVVRSVTYSPPHIG